MCSIHCGLHGPMHHLWHPIWWFVTGALSNDKDTSVLQFHRCSHPTCWWWGIVLKMTLRCNRMHAFHGHLAWPNYSHDHLPYLQAKCWSCGMFCVITIITTARSGPGITKHQWLVRMLPSHLYIPLWLIWPFLALPPPPPPPWWIVSAHHGECGKQSQAVYSGFNA